MVEAVNNNNNSTGVCGNLAVAAAATAGAAGGAVYGVKRTPEAVSKIITQSLIDKSKIGSLPESHRSIAKNIADIVDFSAKIVANPGEQIQSSQKKIQQLSQRVKNELNDIGKQKVGDVAEKIIPSTTANIVDNLLSPESITGNKAKITEVIDKLGKQAGIENIKEETFSGLLNKAGQQVGIENLEGQTVSSTIGELGEKARKAAPDLINTAEEATNKIVDDLGKKAGIENIKEETFSGLLNKAGQQAGIENLSGQTVSSTIGELGEKARKAAPDLINTAEEATNKIVDDLGRKAGIENIKEETFSGLLNKAGQQVGIENLEGQTVGQFVDHLGEKVEINTRELRKPENIKTAGKNIADQIFTAVEKRTGESIDREQTIKGIFSPLIDQIHSFHSEKIKPFFDSGFIKKDGIKNVSSKIKAALVRTPAMWAAGGAAVLGSVAVGVNYLINRSKKSESSQEV